MHHFAAQIIQTVSSVLFCVRHAQQKKELPTSKPKKADPSPQSGMHL
jgi:hypothetical protein